MSLPRTKITHAMHNSQKKLEDMLRSGQFTRYDLHVMAHLMKTACAPGSQLYILARKGLEKGILSIYEAFQLQNQYMSLFEHRSIYTPDLDCVKSMNMALMARLFDEKALYDAYCADALSARDRLLRMTGSDKTGSFIMDDIGGFLGADREHMELLSKKRHLSNRGMLDDEEDETYHFHFFPYKSFAFEDEFLKVYRGSAEGYIPDKTVSGAVCDIMAAAELRKEETDRMW